MSEQPTTLGEFAGSRDDTDEDPAIDPGTGDSSQAANEIVDPRSDQEETLDDDGAEVELFRLTIDPFVNAGAAALASRLTDRVTVEPTRITCPAATAESVITDLRGIVEEALPNTHRRTSIAHSINHALDQAGFDESDPRWVPRVDEPFPDDLTVFENDEIDPDRLAEHDIPETEAVAEFDSEQGLYVQSEEYTGINSSRYFPNQREDVERYLESFEQILTGRTDPGERKTCLSCGRDDLPSYKDPISEGDVEYKQMFAPLASSSATLKPLGSGGRTSSHRGRCLGCLIAGFYFAIMSKAVRQTGSDDNDARVFTPVGDFDRLVPAMRDIQRNRHDLDDPVGDASVRRRTIGRLDTRAQSLQALDLFETFVREVNPEVVGDGMLRETIYRPTALRTFVSAVGQTREINSLDQVDPDSAIYDRVVQGRHTAGDSERTYWPVSDVLRWYAEYGDPDTQLTEKQLLGEGIIYADLARLERGVFGFTRAQFRGDGRFPTYAQPHPADLTHYITRVMTQAAPDAIDEAEIEAIRRVASGIGTVFHDGDDISVLISLQNASTQSEFLRAFERASMQAQKKSNKNPPAQYNTARDDDVETVLELISNTETFDPAKRMFVIHAAMAAQYENATNTTDEEED